MCFGLVFFFFFSSRRRHTRCALVTGVQTCALPISTLAANNSFKPNLLRYTKAMAEKACHGFASTTQVGLTQALGALGEITMRSVFVILLSTFIAACSTLQQPSRTSVEALLRNELSKLGRASGRDRVWH